MRVKEEPKKVMIVGSGAREHALAWRICQSHPFLKLFVAPGNEGTSLIAENIRLDISNKAEVLRTARELGVELIVVGPEIPLAEGIVDLAQKEGPPAFGPTREAAKLEWSKGFAVELMREHHIPHPQTWLFDTAGAVQTFLRYYGKPVAVKGDGLYGGKAVSICHTEFNAVMSARWCQREFPDRPIVVQELVEGREVSVFCFTDGYNISPLAAACDYKRVLEHNLGDMTGGMGSYAWPEFWDSELEQRVLDYIMRPAIRAMEYRGTPYQGVLYAGLMITEEGPKVLEFNCRLGDPEAQVILPLLETDPLKVMMACINRELDLTRVEWNHELSCVGVVLVSKGYPGSPVGKPAILGEEKLHPSILQFHGGSSGRMLTLAARTCRVQDSADMVYENIRGRLELHDVFFRGDIAAEALR